MVVYDVFANAVTLARNMYTNTVVPDWQCI